MDKQTWGEETAGSGHLSETFCTVSPAPASTPQDGQVTDEGMNGPQLGEGDRWGWAWITGKQREVKMEGKIKVRGEKTHHFVVSFAKYSKTVLFLCWTAFPDGGLTDTCLKSPRSRFILKAAER